MNSRRKTFGRLVAGAILAITLAGCVTISLADQIAALMREARELIAGKRFDEALGKFTQVVKLDAKHWPAYVGMARAYIGKGAWGDAVRSARDAYQLAPSGQDVVPVFAEALLGGGTDALRGGRFADAIGYLGDYIKLQPNNVGAYMDIGKAFLGNGQYAQALEALLKGLGLAGQGGGGPDRSAFIRTIFDGGMQAFQKNDYRNAIGFFREYVKSDSSNVQAWLNLGRSYWNAGDRAQALDAFRDVLKLAPANTEALRFMLQR